MVMSCGSISVIIPAYNAERYICAALDSVARQTLLPSEVIVINDGSTDQTGTVVRNWMATQSSSYPVHLLDQSNLGLPATRNVGIKHAVGDWIALLDADDIWEALHLQELAGAIGAWPSAVASYGAGRLLQGERVSETLYDDYWDNPSKKYGKRIDNSHCLRLDFSVFPRLVQGSFIKPSSLMFSRVVALEMGLFDEEFRTAGEREFQARLIRSGDLVYCPVPITQYRWHDDNISNGKNARRNMGNGLRALQCIRNNQGLALTSAEAMVCQGEIQKLAKGYLYLCSRVGWHDYRTGFEFLRQLFGWWTPLLAVRLTHIFRCFVRG